MVKIPIRLPIMMLVGLVFLAGCEPGGIDANPQPDNPAPIVNPIRHSKLFSTNEDFSQGVLNGVNYTTQDHQLQMTHGRAVFETPYIWITNSGDNTITQIETKTGEIIAHIPLELNGVKCLNSSRTTVNQDLDVWVACRGSSNVAKISHTEKRVSMIIPVEPGTIPRGIAIDRYGYLWIGCGDNDNNSDKNDLDLVYKINEQTGECIRGNQQGSRACQAPPLEVADWPYGAAVDQHGMLWMLSNHHWTNGTLTKIDTNQDAVNPNGNPIVGVYKRTDGGCSNFYGIAIDQLGYVWTGNLTCNDILKFDNNGNFIAGYLSGGTNTRGVAVDMDGNVWVALSGTNTATKHHGKTGEIIHTLNTGTHPIGPGIDAYGNVWIVNMNSSDVYKINGITYEKQIIPLGNGKAPYTYSDMMGTALNTITLRKDNSATWTVNLDTGIVAPVWKSINWTGEVPPGSAIQVRTRCAASEVSLTTSEWGPYLDDPGSLNCLQVRWIQIEVRFQRPDITNGPVLTDLSVIWEEPEAS